MATRTISTRVAIEGESTYRASVSAINANLRALQSSLKLTESEFRNNANSIEALRAKDTALIAVKDAQKAKVDALRVGLENAKKAVKDHADAQEAAQRKIEAAKAALEKLKSAEGDTSKEQQRLTEEIKKGEEELQYHKDAMASAQKGVANWTTDLNAAQIKLNDMDAAVKLNAEYLAEAEKNADHCATSIDRFGERVEATTSKADELATALADAGIVQAVGKVTDALKECINEYVQFEAQMAAVSRTTGITNEVSADTVITLDELADAIRQMSTEIPITTEQLAAIATTAGQLGISQENVIEFVRIMAMLGTTTDLTADQAATMLAQFSNVVKLDPSNYDRLGATVAALGDSTATTASKIVDMAQGMAAVGSIAGMSETDILGIAAAVGSMGIEAQAGATAMNTFIQNIDKAVATGSEDLNTFADVAGMTAGEFRAAWKNDAADAMNAVITGLGEMTERGENANLALADLGITNARQVKAIASLAEAGDTLTNTLAMADQAWESNTALTEKAETVYGTTQSQIVLMNDKISLLKEAIGSAFAPAITEAAEKAGNLAQGLAEFAEDHPKTVQAIGVVVTSLAGLTAGLAAFQAAKKAVNILELGTAFSKLGPAITSATTAIEGLAVSLGGSLAAGLGLISGMALPVVASIYEIGRSCKETMEEGFIGSGHTLEEYQDNVESYKTKIGELEEEYQALADCGADLTGIQGELDLAHVGLAHAMEEQAAAAEAAAESTEALAEAEESTVEASGEAVGSIEDVNIKLADLAQRYRDAYDAAGQSIEGQLGLFGEFKATLSEDLDESDELIARWLEQTEALGSYTENLQWAAQSGLDDGLVASLADGSAESAAYLALIRDEVEKSGSVIDELGNSSNEAVEKFNSAWEDSQQAREALQETMAGIQVDLADAMAAIEQEAAEVEFPDLAGAIDEAFSGVGLNFQSIAENCDLGLIAGFSSGAEDVKSTVQGLGDDVVSTMENVVQTHSPSEVFREIGENIDAGLEEGISDNAAAVLDSVKSIFDGLTAETNARLQELKSIVQSETASMADTSYTVGTQIVDGMTSGIRSRAGSLYLAMREVVNQSIAEAKAAAAVHSPSRKTKEIFENVGEGMIVGLEEKRQSVAEKAQTVVDEALHLEIPKIPEIDLSGIYASFAMMNEVNRNWTSDDALLRRTQALEGKLDDISTTLRKVLSSEQKVFFEDGTFAGRIARKTNDILGGLV